MKAYKCDICEIAITDPYTVKMKEFYWACDFEIDGIYPAKAKRKQKLHLCGNCFEGIKGIFAKHSSDTVPFEPFGKTERLKPPSAADVVPVVHCKDCKHGQFMASCDRYLCHKVGGSMRNADDFCNYGERRKE